MIRVLQGDVRERLVELADDSFDCIVTSPPYWGLRDYGTAKWEGGLADCDHLAGPLASSKSTLDGTGNHVKLAVGGMPYKSQCGKCGARRIDNQIGLEPTLTEYLDTMVVVCRELRRVLKSSGTFWLNVGDSYAGSGKGGGGSFEADRRQWREGNPEKNKGASNRNGLGLVEGLKPKDLCMVSNRLAIRLQEPWYDGNIKNIEDRIWLAAMIDAEGCMFIHKRKAGSAAYSKYRKADGEVVEYSRTQDTFGVGLEISNTHEAIVRRCVEITGLGSVCEQTNGRRQKLFRWNMRTNECRDVIREIYPHLIGKKHQARLMLGCPSSGDKADKAHRALIALHCGGSAEIDFPAPESLFSPGWFVRSEIIWAKKNCMPESVTDRPTSSHEKIWLLTKSERYWYDAEAIAEPSVEPDRMRADLIGGSSFVERQQHSKGGLFVGAKTRNARNVWTIATQSYSEAHFATFPPDLAERCIKAGCPIGGEVLDPFGGAGTTAMVADRLGRNCTLIELNADYVELIKARIEKDAGMFAQLETVT